MSIKHIVAVVGVVVGLITVVSVSGQIFETNQAGFYHIKQAALTGTMTVVNEPGTYGQFFGHINEYQISDMYYFSKSELDGGNDVGTDAVKVRFNDGGTAEISGSIKYKLSQLDKHQLVLHSDFKSYQNVKHDLIRQVVTEALMQTATLMKAEESYSSRRSEFAALAEEQVEAGIFETVSKEFKEKDADGNEFIEREVNVKRNDAGIPVVRKESPLKKYGIEVIQFVIKDIDFDQTIDALISKKKEAEQQKVVAKANAERAKQDAITAREQGAAEVAKAKALEEVEKIKAVTAAQKEFEVAKFNRLRADEDSKSVILKGEADAKIAKLKVAAGLTPLERATIAKETAIGVAEQLSKIQFPGTMILGGSEKGGAIDPFTAVGLESFMRISEKMSGNKQE